MDVVTRDGRTLVEVPPARVFVPALDSTHLRGARVAILARDSAAGEQYWHGITDDPDDAWRAVSDVVRHGDEPQVMVVEEWRWYAWQRERGTEWPRRSRWAPARLVAVMVEDPTGRR